MRAALAIAALASTLGQAKPPATQPVIVADVDMSEWNPPMVLTLGTGTGRYTVVPPTGPWPAYLPKPPPRAGRLAGGSLAELRAGLDEVIIERRRKDDARPSSPPGCVRGSSNAGLPHLTVKMGKRSFITSDCWTPAEAQFHRLLARLFDHKTP